MSSAQGEELFKRRGSREKPDILRSGLGMDNYISTATVAVPFQ